MAALDWSQCPAVESVPGRLSGAWVFRDTRMPVSAVFENLEAGATIEEIANWFGISKEQIIEVLAFAARSLAAPVPLEPVSASDARTLWPQRTGAAGSLSWRPQGYGGKSPRLGHAFQRRPASRSRACRVRGFSHRRQEHPIPAESRRAQNRRCGAEHSTMAVGSIAHRENYGSGQRSHARQLCRGSYSTQILTSVAPADPISFVQPRLTIIRISAIIEI